MGYAFVLTQDVQVRVYFQLYFHTYGQLV
jgi:hypothetical protein